MALREAVSGVGQTSSKITIVRPSTLRYKWQKVQAGDFIRFQYQGNSPTSKKAYRTVFVLQPRYIHESKVTGKSTELIGGIELFKGMIGRVKRVNQWMAFFEGLGDWEEHAESNWPKTPVVRIDIKKQFFQRRHKGRNEALWKYVVRGIGKGFLGPRPYKTYDFDKVKGNVVYLAQIPFYNNVDWRGDGLDVEGESRVLAG